MNKLQRGFAVVESLLILVVIAIIGGTGYYVWHTKSQTDKTLNTAANTNQTAVNKSSSTASNQSADTPLETSSTPGFLSIKEWGVKVKLGSADPSIVSYKLNTSDNCPGGSCSGSVALSLTSGVKSQCQSLGININRRDYNLIDRTPATDSRDVKQVGTYWYDVSGSPGSCGDSYSDSIRAQYLGNNPYSWEYLAL